MISFFYLVISFLHESSREIASGDKVGRLVVSRAVIVVNGFADVVVVYPYDALRIVLGVESCLENKAHIHLAHVKRRRNVWAKFLVHVSNVEVAILQLILVRPVVHHL